MIVAPPSSRSMDRLMLAEKCRRSFSFFVQTFWSIIEPGVPLIWNWHAQAICDHLQAVAEGQFRRLMIAVPPGHAKSLFVSVFWQPWIWCTNPSFRQLCGAYEEGLTFRDSLRARDVIKSKRYQDLFIPDWYIRRDQDSKGFFINSENGYRKTFYMTSRKKTGWRADSIIIDDPLSAENRYDKNIKKAVIDTFDGVMSTRVNRLSMATFVIIMQRLADDDLIGHVLKKYGDDYVYLMLPARFDPDRCCETPMQSPPWPDPMWPDGFRDPRKEKGELLFPALFPEDEVRRLEIKLGPVDADAQLEHNPHPEGGNRFESIYFQFWKWTGSSMIKVMHRSGAEEFHRVDLLPKFMTVDPACSEKTSADFTVIGLWAITNKNEIILLHRVKMQGGEPAVIEAVRNVFFMQDFGRINPMWIGFESNGLGLPILQACQSSTPSLPCIEIHVHKDKFVMAATAVVRIYGGQIFFPDYSQNEWVRDFTDYLVRFPGADHDDDVSMLSLAANSMYEKTVPILGKTMPMGQTPVQNDATRTRADLGRRGLFGAK